MTNAELFSGFASWLDGWLAQPVPQNIVAFSVNLYEGTGTFDVQLSGNTSYDSDDQSWACNPAYTTGESLFSVPRDFVSNEWERALDLILAFVKEYLKTGRHGYVLKGRSAVAVGFVDGDLHQVWPPSDV
jgi:hypothetical protein